MDRVQKSLNVFRKVLIVDDHPLYSDALSEVIKLEIGTTQFHFASSLEAACQLLSKRLNPSIVFLDLNLPDTTGMSGIYNLRKRLDGTPIVICSATSNAQTIENTREAGASGFICKNISREELVDNLLKIHQGDIVFAHSDSEPNAAHVDLADVSERLARLTAQQTRILQMICQGMLNKQIAFELNLAEATVKTHMTAMMRKLAVQNRTQAALLIREATMVADLQ